MAALSTILLIVQDDATRQAVETRLVSNGMQVRTAATATEALNLLAVWVPQIIAIDLMFPWINGAALLLAIREDPRLSQVPVVITTGPANKADDLQPYAPVVVVKKHHRLGSVAEAVLRLAESGVRDR